MKKLIPPGIPRPPGKCSASTRKGTIRSRMTGTQSGIRTMMTFRKVSGTGPGTGLMKTTSRNIVTIRYSDLSDSKITIVPTTSPVSDTCSWKIISPESMRPNSFCLMFRADSGIALKTIFHIRRGSWTAFPRLTANAISRYRHYLPTLGREIHPIILTEMIFRKSNERITINFAPRIWRTTSGFLKVRLRVREKSCAPEHMRA